MCRSLDQRYPNHDVPVLLLTGTSPDSDICGLPGTAVVPCYHSRRNITVRTENFRIGLPFRLTTRRFVTGYIDRFVWISHNGFIKTAMGFLAPIGTTVNAPGTTQGRLQPREARYRFRVKYIYLCVELEHYSSLEAYSGDDEFVSKRDFVLVTKAIQRLFRELSRWQPIGELLLDISIHSPSDSNYLLKYLTFEPDMPSEECLSLDDVDDMDKGGHAWNEWVAAGKAGTSIRKTMNLIGVEDPSLDEEAYDREVDWLDKLPDVPAVTGVLLRQQTRRTWSWPMLTEMLDHFPNLQQVFYEPWRLRNPESQDEADNGKTSPVACLALTSPTFVISTIANIRLQPGYDRLIDHLTRRGVRKLTIFENCNRYYAPLFPGYRHARTLMPGSQYTGTSKALNRTAALGSRELEHFSASYLVEAALFFASCRPSWMWPNLTSLSLTSAWLAPNATQDLVKMLTSAATVACRMPKLETLQLWNGRKRLAALFQYQSKPATITWRSTWVFGSLPSVIPVWEDVAHKHGAGQLLVKKELLIRNDIKSHGDAIHSLKLSHPVVRPISLQQIRREHKVHRIWEKMRSAKAKRDEEDEASIASLKYCASTDFSLNAEILAGTVAVQENIGTVRCKKPARVGHIGAVVPVQTAGANKIAPNTHAAAHRNLLMA